MCCLQESECYYTASTDSGNIMWTVCRLDWFYVYCYYYYLCIFVIPCSVCRLNWIFNEGTQVQYSDEFLIVHHWIIHVYIDASDCLLSGCFIHSIVLVYVCTLVFCVRCLHRRSHTHLPPLCIKSSATTSVHPTLSINSSQRAVSQHIATANHHHE